MRKPAPDADGKVTVPMALVVYAYVGMILALPFMEAWVSDDAGISSVLLFPMWLGGSVIAGALVPRRFIYVVPIMALVALECVAFGGYSDSGFFSDPFVVIALVTMAGGELAGLWAGFALRRRLAG
jgi:hypothetical protein